MRVRIINTELDDSVVLGADTFDELFAIVQQEVKRRNWKSEDWYSQELK